MAMATRFFKAHSASLLRAVARPAFRFTNHIRAIHSMNSPYTGPPGYDTLVRRFCSDINAQEYFPQVRKLEAKARGEYVDIHDISGVSPKDFDVLLTDVNDESLRTEIAEIVGIPYLAEATQAEQEKNVKSAVAYLHGVKLRTIFPAVVGYRGKAYWVFFIINTGSPLSYLSEQACKLFDIKENSPVVTNIAGKFHQVHMSPSTSHFSEVNLLGADFVCQHNLTLSYDYGKRRVEVRFGSD